MRLEIERNEDVAQESWRASMLYQNRLRTSLSNERTFLAWVRTSLALITLGFVVQRFDLLVGKGRSVDVAARASTRWVPLLFFVLGALLVALGTWSFFRVKNSLTHEAVVARSRLRDALVVTVLVFLLGISLIFMLSAPS